MESMRIDSYLMSLFLTQPSTASYAFDPTFSDKLIQLNPTVALTPTSLNVEVSLIGNSHDIDIGCVTSSTRL